jgi:hypothetical protein
LYSTSGGAGRGEGSAHVCGSRRPIQAGLGTCRVLAAQGSNQGQIEPSGYWPGDLLCLVEASAQVAAPVKGDRNHQIGVFEREPVTMAQSAAEMLA